MVRIQRGSLGLDEPPSKAEKKQFNGIDKRLNEYILDTS